MNRETGERYLALFNLREEEQVLSCDLDEVEQFARRPGSLDGKVKELWSETWVDLEQGKISQPVPAHGTKLYKL